MFDSVHGQTAAACTPPCSTTAIFDLARVPGPFRVPAAHSTTADVKATTKTVFPFIGGQEQEHAKSTPTNQCFYEHLNFMLFVIKILKSTGEEQEIYARIS